MDTEALRPPLGEITEIVGRLSSGRTSLLLRWLAVVTGSGDAAALVDTDDTFDPGFAGRMGIDLRRLLWVRGDGRRTLALRAADLLVRRPGFGLIALDTGEIAPRISLPAVFRLKLAVRRTHTALVILGRRRIAGPGAALAVETVQEGLEWAGPDTHATRLDALRTRLQLLRWRDAGCAYTAWPRDIRWSA